METTNPMTRKAATYPLPANAPKKLKWVIAIAPLFFALSVGWTIFSRNSLNTFIMDEASAMAAFSLIMMLSSLASTMFNPVGGKLGDLFGRKRVAVILMIPYAFSIFLTGVAKGPVMIGIAYFIMGMLQNCMLALCNGMIIDSFDSADRTRLLSISNSMDALGGMLAPIVAGYLARSVGAQRAFLFCLILLGIAWVLTLVIYPDIRNIKHDVKVDVKGMIAMWFGIGPICLALSMGGKQLPWNSPIIWAMFAVGAASLVLFYKVEQKQVQPIVNFDLFRAPGVINIICLSALMAVIGAVNQYFNLYVTKICGFDSVQVGYLSLLVIIPVILNPIIGAFIAKTGKFKLIFILSGVAGIICSLMYCFVLNPAAPVWLAASCKLFQYLMSVLNQAPVFAYIGATMPADKRGMALGVQAFSSTLLASVLSAIFAAVMNAKGGDISVAWRTMCYIFIGCTILRTYVATTVHPVDRLKATLASLNKN